MMKKKSILAFLALLALAPFMTLLGRGSGNDQKSKATACTNPHPAQPPTRAEQAAPAASLRFDARMEAMARP